MFKLYFYTISIYSFLLEGKGKKKVNSESYLKIVLNTLPPKISEQREPSESGEREEIALHFPLKF